MLQGAAVAAQRKIKENFPYSFVSSVLFLGGIWWIIPRYGAFSFAYISVAGLLLSAFINGLFFRRHLSAIPYLGMYGEMAKIMLLNGISLLPAAWVRTQLPVLPYYGTIFICGSMYVGALAILYKSQNYWKRLTAGFGR